MALFPVKYDKNPDSASFRVWLTCRKCGARKRPFQMMADTEGKPYDAYECRDCNERPTNNPEA